MHRINCEHGLRNYRGILRGAWRQSQWRKKIPSISDSADSHSTGKRAIRNELYRCKWKIWFDASRIIKQFLLFPLFFFYISFFTYLCERGINSRFTFSLPSWLRFISHISKNWINNVTKLQFKISFNFTNLTKLHCNFRIFSYSI